MNTHRIINDDGEIISEKQGVFLRTAFNYDMNAASDESGLYCPEETKAQQHMKDECDINVIVERFGLTGQLPADLKTPMQGDFTNVHDFQTALNLVIEARDAFMQLPANVRARFHNDPQEFLEFTSDEANRDEAKKLGILVDRKEDPPLPVRVIPDPDTAPK